MKYYTSTIPPPLAEKLKEKGYPQDHDAHHLWANETIYEAFWTTEFDRVKIENAYDDGTLVSVPYYSEVFDWLMEKGFDVAVYGCGSGYHWNIDKFCDDCTRGTRKAYSQCGDGLNDGGCYDTWHEAANAAIKKALILI